MAGEQWYYAKGGERLGPVSAAQIRAAYERGEISDADYVWTDGMANWAPAGQVRDQFMYADVSGDALGSMGIPPVDLDLGAPAAYASPTVYRSTFSNYAGFWRRFVAAIIDGILLWVVQLPIGIIFGAGTATPVIDPNMPPEQQTEIAFQLMSSALIQQSIGWIIYLAYYSFMESSKFQGTVGKMALGIKVTDTDGAPISFGRALGRNAAKFISGLICLVGYIMAAFTERKQALHDMIAGTLVVQK